MFLTASFLRGSSRYLVVVSNICKNFSYFSIFRHAYDSHAKLGVLANFLLVFFFNTAKSSENYIPAPLNGNKINYIFFNLPSKIQLSIVLWSHLCVVVASQSLYLDKKWRKKGSFPINLLSKISAKAKNNLCSYRELNPSLLHERSATKPIDHQVLQIILALNWVTE